MARRAPTIKTVVAEAVPHGARLLVCVSGGRDSIVLLHVLHGLSRQRALFLAVAHVDHRLRSNSADDARFVAGQAAHYGLPYYSTTLPDRPPSVNTEAWARMHRYEFFDRERRREKLDWIVTAHNSNDVAENLLMRLVANKEAGEIAEADSERARLRPLLGVTRAQIDEYVAHYKLSYTEDPSNADIALTRNKVRHLLLPLLAREFDPGVVRSLSDRARSLARDGAYFAEVVESMLERIGPLRERDGEWLARVCRELSGAHSSLQWRLVERIFLETVGYPLGERRSMPVVALLLGSGSRVDVGSGMTLVMLEVGIQIEHRQPD